MRFFIPSIILAVFTLTQAYPGLAKPAPRLPNPYLGLPKPYARPPNPYLGRPKAHPGRPKAYTGHTKPQIGRPRVAGTRMFQLGPHMVKGGGISRQPTPRSKGTKKCAPGQQ